MVISINVVMKSNDSLEATCICTLLAKKEADFQGLVQRSDSRFPFKVVAEEPLSMATLLFLLPRAILSQM